MSSNRVSQSRIRSTRSSMRSHHRGRVLITWNKLRIDPNDGSPILEYRIQNGRVEHRSQAAVQRDIPSEMHWQQLTPEQLTSHATLGTVLPMWLSRRLGVHSPIRTCTQHSLPIDNRVQQSSQYAQETAVCAVNSLPIGRDSSGNPQERGKMTFTGTLLKDLQCFVDFCLQSNARVCAVCGERYEKHSKVGANCPDSASTVSRYLQNSFAQKA